MSDWHVVGPHRYRMEEDILYWRPDGEVLSEHALVVCALFDQLIERYGYCLWLVDARRSVAIGYETRKTYVRWFQKLTRDCLAVASFGASLPAKTTASLILRGVQLVQGINVVTELFLGEAAARAYLERQRPLMRTLVAS